MSASEAVFGLRILHCSHQVILVLWKTNSTFAHIFLYTAYQSFIWRPISIDHIATFVIDASYS